MKASISQIADWCGMDRRTIAKRVAHLECDDHGVRGKLYDAPEALRAIFLGDEGLDPAQEKARLDESRRRLADLEYQKRRGELFHENSVFKVLDSAATAFREGLLTIPGRLANTLATETDARIIENQLFSEIRDQLIHLTSVSPEHMRDGSN